MQRTLAVEGMLKYRSEEDGYAVIFREVEGTRKCIMKFDVMTVRFLQAAQQHEQTRHLPFGHSAVMDLLAMAGLILKHCVISDSNQNFFRTTLYFRYRNGEVVRELLPSDALAMALHADCPILIEDALLDEANRHAVTHLKNFTSGNPTSSQSAEFEARHLPSDALPQS